MSMGLQFYTNALIVDRRDFDFISFLENIISLTNRQLTRQPITERTGGRGRERKRENEI